MKLEFDMPGDQNWDPEFWGRLGVGPEWEKLSAAFSAAGATVEDSEMITVRFPAGREPEVRKVIEDARAGKYGADIQIYWRAASEE